MMITGERRDKFTMLKGLKPGHIKTKLMERNTIKAWYPDGTIIIRYWDTDVVTQHPDGSITLNSGGFMTHTTKRRMEDNTRVRIIQKDSIWYICRNMHEWPAVIPGDMPMFYDGITINAAGVVTSGIRTYPADVVKQFRRDLKTLINKIGPEPIQPSAGDCWICIADHNAGKVTADHLLAHVKEGYMHGSLIRLCLSRCGYGPGVFTSWYQDINRRAVRKVIMETCMPVILENPAAYTDCLEEVI